MYSQFWRLEVRDQGVGRTGFSWSCSPSLVDSYFPSLSTCGLLSVRFCFLISSCKDTSHSVLELSLFNSIVYLKTLIPNSHIPSYWELELQHVLWGGHNSAHDTEAKKIFPGNHPKRFPLFLNNSYVLMWGIERKQQFCDLAG